MKTRNIKGEKYLLVEDVKDWILNTERLIGLCDRMDSVEGNTERLISYTDGVKKCLDWLKNDIEE